MTKYRNISREKKKMKIVAIVFLSILLCIFIMAMLISWPWHVPVDIAESGKSSLEEVTKEYYVLQPDSYEVLGKFGQVKINDSSFVYLHTYVYYGVLVTDHHGKQFVMAVRTEKKNEALLSGKPVMLYGMVSKLDEDLSDKLIDLSPNHTFPVYEMCLNDNDISVRTRYVQTVIMAFLSILAVSMIIYLIKH